MKLSKSPNCCPISTIIYLDFASITLCTTSLLFVTWKFLFFWQVCWSLPFVRLVPLTFNCLQVTILNRSSWNFTKWSSQWSDRIIFIFEIKKQKNQKIIGQRSTTFCKFLKLSIFHSIDLKFEQDLHISSLHSTN